MGALDYLKDELATLQDGWLAAPPANPRGDDRARALASTDAR